MKFKQVGNISISGVSAVIGQPVLGGTPDWILYIDNAGNLFGDNNATRDSITNDTYILKGTVGTFQNFLGIGDTGGGVDAATIGRSDTSSSLGSAWLAIDGTALGSPDAAVLYASMFDATGNQGYQMIADSTSLFAVSGANGGGSAILSLAHAGGSSLNWDNLNGAGTIDVSIGVNAAGQVGWSDNILGQTFVLPLVTNGAGAVLTDVAGNGVLSLQPPGASSAIIPGVTPVTPTGGSGNPTEVLYIKGDGTIWSDSEFTRENVSHESLLSTTALQGGYTTGYFMGTSPTYDPFSLGGYINIMHLTGNAVGTGSLVQLSDTSATMQTRNFAVGRQVQSGFFAVNPTPGSEYAEMTTFDTGVGTTYSSSVFLSPAGIQNRFHYAAGGNNDNYTILDGNNYQIISDRLALANVVLDFDFVNGVYSYGDPTNQLNGWQTGIDIPNRIWFAGDLAGNNNGTTFFANDVLQTSGFGDVLGAQNQSSIVIDDNTQTVGSQGKVGGVVGAGWLLDYANNGYSMGDVAAVWNKTRITVDDAEQEIFGYTSDGGVSVARMFTTGKPAGTSITTFGYGAGNNTMSGVRNTLIGRLSGNALTSGFGNTFLGEDTGPVTTTEQYNVFIGWASGGIAGVSKSIALGTSSSARVSGQFIAGSSFAPVREMVVGGGDANGGPLSTLWRTSASSGIDIPGADMTIRGSVATGNAATGNLFFESALPIASGATLQTPSIWGQISPSVVKWGDISSAGNDTILTINDSTKVVTVQTDLAFIISDVATNTIVDINTNFSTAIIGANTWTSALSIDGGVAAIAKLGDVNSVGNDTLITVDDVSSVIRLDTDKHIVLNGGQVVKFAQVNNTDYNVTLNDYCLMFVSMTADRTCTLPDSTTTPIGTVFVIKNWYVENYNVIVEVDSGSIDDVLTITLLPSESIRVLNIGGGSYITID